MLKAGFARVDITPPLGSVITGYFEERRSKGILDPLYLNALAYGDGEKTNVLITCDATNLAAGYLNKVRALIESETGVDKDALFIGATHSHTAFSVNTIDPERNPGSVFEEMLSRKFADAAKMALDDLDDAEAYTAQRETPEQISFVRRYVMRDGGIRTNPGYGNPDVLRPISDADYTVRLVRFKRAHSPDIALLGFQTHPDVVGGEKYSADWPGFVRRYVEKDIGGVRCVLLNGCQGDVNHINVKTPSLLPDVPKGCYDYRYSRRLGRIIADTVPDIGETGEKRPDGKVFSAVRAVSVPTNRLGAEKYEEAKAVMRDNVENGVWYSMERLGEARRIIQLFNTPESINVPVSVQGFSDVLFVGFGGEPFSRYATEVRRAFPSSFVLTGCLTNGGEGYLPTEEAFAEGGYEARTSRFTSALPQLIKNETFDLIKRFGLK